MKTRNKKDLAQHVASQYKIKKEMAEDIIQSLFLEIEREIKKGNKVNIVGFGSFYSKLMNSRTSINPRSGELFHQKERYMVKFKLGKKLKNLHKQKNP